MHTRFNIRSIIFIIFFGLLAACTQKPETNSPEVRKQQADELRNAASGTFVRSLADHVVRITFVSKEKDTFTAIEPDGTFRTYSITASAKTVDEIVPPGHHNYDGYARMYPELAMQAVLAKHGPRPIVLMDDGSAMVIINPTYQTGLAIVSKSVGTRQVLSTDEIAAHTVHIVSAKHHGNAAEIYDKLASCYTSGTKWPIPKY